MDGRSVTRNQNLDHPVWRSIGELTPIRKGLPLSQPIAQRIRALSGSGTSGWDDYPYGAAMALGLALPRQIFRCNFGGAPSFSGAPRERFRLLAIRFFLVLLVHGRPLQGISTSIWSSCQAINSRLRKVNLVAKLLQMMNRIPQWSMTDTKSALTDAYISSNPVG